MYYSLSSNEIITKDHLDMRHLWYTGEAKNKFSNFFHPKHFIMEVNEFNSHIEDVVQHIINSAKKQNLNVYRHTILNTPTFSVVKTAMSQ